MAKGSPFTTFTGKLGQIVGFIIKSAASKQVQGMRAYQPNVANPKTVLQANQRLCLKPLNNFARALAPVIERGFEGMKYGTESRREFMRINMSSFNGPYLRKGNDDAVPGPFLISKGSLVPITVEGMVSSSVFPSGMAKTDLFLASADTPTTVGALSSRLIECNTDIKDGDQLTFIAVVSAAGQYVYRTVSLTVDSTSTEAFETVSSGVRRLGIFNIVARNFGTTEVPDYRLDFCIGAVAADEVMVGAAVIQSREGDSGQHLRSDAIMCVSAGIYDVWMSQEQYEAALASYMGDTAVVDWPVQQTAASAIILQESVSVHVPATDLVGQSAENFPNGVDVMGFVMSDGTVGVWVDSENELLDMLGRRIGYVVTEQTYYVTLASGSAIPTKLYFGGVVSA